jgi:hypothetical protein
MGPASESLAVLVGKREKIGQDHLPSRLRRVLQVRLKGKRHKRSGRTDGQPCMTGSHTVHFAIASVARAIEAADFSESPHEGGELLGAI